MSRACLVCGAPLEQPRTGRPPTYCDEPCRRAAEYELRRIQRRLERLEDALPQWEQYPGTEAQQARIRDEMQQLQARLLTLLGKDDAWVSPPSPNGGG